MPFGRNDTIDAEIASAGCAMVARCGDPHEHPAVRCEDELIDLAGIRGQAEDGAVREEVVPLKSLYASTRLVDVT